MGYITIESIGGIIILSIISMYYLQKYLNKRKARIESKGKPKTKEKKTDLLDRFPIGNLLGGFIVILVGVILIPTIADQIREKGATGVSSTVINLVSIFFALGIFVAGVSLAIPFIKGLK